MSVIFIEQSDRAGEAYPGRKEKERIRGSGGVRRGVWQPLSCLLKASFFPSLPPLGEADRTYFHGPRSARARAVVCLLHRVLRGSQKLKPEGVSASAVLACLPEHS